MGAFNWQQFHQQQADGYRRVASNYRRAATELHETQPDYASFAIQRATINETWADESEQKAREVAA